MAETNDSDLPIQGKLITQKVTKNELQIEIIINDIRKCDSGNDEIEELRRKARKALQGVSSDIQVGNPTHEKLNYFTTMRLWSHPPCGQYRTALDMS